MSAALLEKIRAEASARALAGRKLEEVRLHPVAFRQLAGYLRARITFEGDLGNRDEIRQNTMILQIAGQPVTVRSDPDVPNDGHPRFAPAGNTALEAGADWAEMRRLRHEVQAAAKAIAVLEEQGEQARRRIVDLTWWARYALETWAPPGSDKAEKMRTLVEQAATETSARTDRSAFEAGFDAGWEESGEGHNAEYSKMSTDEYAAKVAAAWQGFTTRRSG